MGFFITLILIIFLLLFIMQVDKANELRKQEQNRIMEEEKRKKAEENERIERIERNKSLKPLQDRLRDFLKSHPGETFTHEELVKHLDITGDPYELMLFCNIMEEKAEENERIERKKILKPLQDRLRDFLKSHPGETFTQKELRKHLSIATSSEDDLLFTILQGACIKDIKYSYISGKSEFTEYYIEGVKVYQISNQRNDKYEAYYVDPR